VAALEQRRRRGQSLPQTSRSAPKAFNQYGPIEAMGVARLWPTSVESDSKPALAM